MGVQDQEIVENLVDMIRCGKAVEFVIVCETAKGTKLSFRSPQGKRLAGWAYRNLSGDRGGEEAVSRRGTAHL